MNIKDVSNGYIETKAKIIKLIQWISFIVQWYRAANSQMSNQLIIQDTFDSCCTQSGETPILPFTNARWRWTYLTWISTLNPMAINTDKSDYMNLLVRWTTSDDGQMEIPPGLIQYCIDWSNLYFNAAVTVISQQPLLGCDPRRWWPW